MKRIGYAAGALGLAVFVACSSSSAPRETICPTAVRADFSPAETTVVVGQQFTASLKIYECLSSVPSRATVKGWASRDPGIASVDSLSGLVIANGAGRTVLTAYANGTLFGGLVVNVR